MVTQCRRQAQNFITEFHRIVATLFFQNFGVVVGEPRYHRVRDGKPLAPSCTGVARHPGSLRHVQRRLTLRTDDSDRTQAALVDGHAELALRTRHRPEIRGRSIEVGLELIVHEFRRAGKNRARVGSVR